MISGIEFSTATSEGVSLHILGYNIDIYNKKLIAMCEHIREKRDERNAKLLIALNEEGYKLSPEDLIFHNNQDFIGKPTFALAMTKKGYIEKPADAFRDVFSTEKMRAIKKEKISEKTAIDIISDAGGTAVLAHPGLIHHIGQRGSEEFYSNLDKILKKLRREGLAGLECYYSKHSQDEENRFLKLAKKNHLTITQGSDYHGPDMER